MKVQLPQEPLQVSSALESTPEPLVRTLRETYVGIAGVSRLRQIVWKMLGRHVPVLAFSIICHVIDRSKLRTVDDQAPASDDFVGCVRARADFGHRNLLDGQPGAARAFDT